MKKTKRHILGMIIALTLISGLTAVSVFAATYDTDTFKLEVTVNEYQAITNACSGSMDLTPINPLRAVDGERYGSDSCQIEIIHNDPTTNFQVDINKPQPGSLIELSGQPFSDIANAGNVDCLIDRSGNTEDEEYGYRLDNVAVVSGVNVEADTECTTSTTYYNSSYGTPPAEYNQYLFDIEYEAGDTVITSTGTSPAPTCLSGDCTFDLVVAANVDWDTYADTTYFDFSTGGVYTIDVKTSVIP